MFLKGLQNNWDFPQWKTPALEQIKSCQKVDFALNEACHIITVTPQALRPPCKNPREYEYARHPLPYREEQQVSRLRSPKGFLNSVSEE